jgi:hypothetical protein
MSITDVKPDYDLDASTDYLVFGVGAKKRKHEAAGSNRIAPGFYCDAPSVNAFVALGQELAKKNGRKVKAQSYVLSFAPEEFSVEDPQDLQRVGDAAFLLAKKMHPNSPCLVVVHADGEGKAAHAHIKVLNHDTLTGNALRNFRVHWQVKKVNDALMQELGMQVLEAKPKQPKDAWSRRRSQLPEFEQHLGDLCAAAKAEALAETLADASPSMDKFTAQFAASCRTRGVELVTDDYRVKSDKRRGKQEGESAVGFTFKMRDETTLRPRLRRRKASALSSEFTHDSIAGQINLRGAALMALSPVQAVPLHDSKLSWLGSGTQGRKPNRNPTPGVASAGEWREKMLAALEDAHAQSQVSTDARIRKFKQDREPTKLPELVPEVTLAGPINTYPQAPAEPMAQGKMPQVIAAEADLAEPTLRDGEEGEPVDASEVLGIDAAITVQSVSPVAGKEVDPHLAAAKKKVRRQQQLRRDLLSTEAEPERDDDGPILWP